LTLWLNNHSITFVTTGEIAMPLCLTRPLDAFHHFLWNKNNVTDASLFLIAAAIIIREGIGCLLFALI
jgi:hypothetical protein